MGRSLTGDGAPILGIIGKSPSGERGPITCRSFKSFQQRLGELEGEPPGSYWSAHAACHAFMNGITEVVFVGVDDLDESEAIVAAFELLVAIEPGLSLVVAPGVQRAGPDLAAAVRRWCSRKGKTASAAKLWLDAPDRALTADIVAYLEETRASTSAVCVVTPWVETVTPGRRRGESLPPSCLVAPLYLGTADTLRGVHSIDRKVSLADRTALRTAGCGLLAVSSGRRRLVHLAFPEPTGRIREPIRPIGLQQRIEAALEERCEALLDGRPAGPSLWHSLVRDARAVMETFKRRGEIVAYGVRCDEETNMNTPDGVGLEVWIQEPKRVKKLILHVGVRS